MSAVPCVSVYVCVRTLPTLLRRRQPGPAILRTPSSPLCCLISLKAKHTSPLSVYLLRSPFLLLPFQSFLTNVFPATLTSDCSWLFCLHPSQVAHCRLRLAQPINRKVLTNNERHFNQLFQDTTFHCLETAGLFCFLD